MRSSRRFLRNFANKEDAELGLIESTGNQVLAWNPFAESDFLIHDKPYEKHDGTATFAPYVDVTISTDRKPVYARFKARIDTGADITCIPANQAKKLMPLFRGRTQLTRGYDGSPKRARTFLIVVSVHGYPDRDQPKSYRPERGVLLTDSDIGLIGMDIISKYWKLTLDGVSQRFSVEIR